jgi:DNA-binding NarL/FixJ family response regulator
VAADLHALHAAVRVLAGQVRVGAARQAPVTPRGAPLRPLAIVGSASKGGGPVLMVVLPPSPGTHPVFATLTARERQVTALLAGGLTNRQVAAALVVPVVSVDPLVRGILAKTGLPSRGAVAYAWRTNSVNGRHG